MEVAVAQGGLLKGPRAMAVIVGWMVAEQMLGHPPTLEEYQEWWKLSRATAFRDQALFRECFPAETTPQQIADLVRARHPEWQRGGVKGLGRLVIEGATGGAAG